MAESSPVASRLPDWAAVDAAWRRNLARGVCGMTELVCLAAIVLFCAKQFNTAFRVKRLYLAICQSGAGFGKDLLHYRDHGGRRDKAKINCVRRKQ
jgi:hypothetical protein